MLFDTHAMIWFDQGSLSHRTVPRLIEEARRNRHLWFSPVSIYEIAVLADRERIVLGVPVMQWVDRFRYFYGFRVAYTTLKIAEDAGRLPHLDHRDPLDRMLIATARYLNVPIVTRDRVILDYARETGEVGVVPC